MPNPIRRKNAGNQRYTTGIGYVVLPTDVDRETYIQNCYNISAVCILTEDHEFIVDVIVTNEILDKLVFPPYKKGEIKLGTAVVFVNEYISNKPIIIGTLSKRDQMTPVLSQNEFRIQRQGKTGESVSISGQPDKGLLAVNVESKGNALLKINVNGMNSGFDLESDICKISGDQFRLKLGEGFSIEILKPEQNAKSTSIKYTESEGFVYKDEFGNEFIIKEGEISQKTKKWTLNSGKEPMLLGEQTTSFIDKLLTNIGNITTTTAIGVQPILNKLDFEKMKKDLEKLKSKIAFIE